MEAEVAIVISIITTLIALGGFLGVNTYLQARAKHKADIRNAEEDRHRAEMQELEQKKKEETIRNIVKDEVDPLKEEITEIKENTKSSLEADVLALRCNMKSLRDRVKKQGYADIGDKATFVEIYNKYKDLGGNHFIEYVDN